MGFYFCVFLFNFSNNALFYASFSMRLEMKTLLLQREFENNRLKDKCMNTVSEKLAEKSLNFFPMLHSELSHIK